MATIEKLIKAFEALKVFQAAASTVEDVVTVKKKDQPLSKKDKMMNCNLIADCICSPSMRTVGDFPKFLGIAMETFLALTDDPESDIRMVVDECLNRLIKGIAMEMFLTLTDDPESDIRMVVDECLNRLIKTLIETNLGRLQVELYKEIKKNGSPRCLRAALWRFAEMAHLIKPQKCRPYIVNLLPCLVRICKREDEGIQETLLQSMNKIAPALMVFGNDAEIKILLKAFIPNLKSSMASCRRTAATSLTLVCQYSRSPPTFLNFLLMNLLDIVLPVETDIDKNTLVGVILCIRSIIPQLMNDSRDAEDIVLPVETDIDKNTLVGVILCIRSIIPQLMNDSRDAEGMRGSFGENKQKKEEQLSIQQVLTVYQFLLFHTGHTDHNVVTAALEALLQLLRSPPINLREVLVSDTVIKETYIYQTDMQTLKKVDGLSEVPSSSQLSVASEDTGLDEESESCDIKSQSGVSATSSSAYGSEGDGVTTQQVDQESVDRDSITELEDREEGLVFNTENSTDYSNVEIGDIQEDRSEKSSLSNINLGSQETLLSIKSLSPTHHVETRFEVGKDMNGNPELVVETDVPEPLSPVGDMTESDVATSIGSMTDGRPLTYFIRLITRRFLLTGVKGALTPDRKVRVSIKSLALSNIGSAMCLCPNILLESLFYTEVEEKSSLSNINLGSQETLLSIKSLSPTHQVETRFEVGKDMNGNPELVVETNVPEPLSPVADTTESDVATSIGSMTDGRPLTYFIRLITRRFLLTGVKGALTPDRKVRVSIKSLALSNIGSAMCLCPNILLESLFYTEVEAFGSPPCIHDVLLYSSHTDPQLRGAVALLVGNFITQVLPAGNGDFNKWLQVHAKVNQTNLSLVKLMEIILCVSEDTSSVAARMGISALGTCITALLHSVHGDIALTTLLKLLQVKNNPYWLVKVELLELIQKLDFRVVCYLEKLCTPSVKKHNFLGSMNLQDHILEDIVIVYLDDDDSRVRTAASNTLVRLVEHLFYSVDYPHQDPVIAITKNLTDGFLNPIMHDWCQAPPPPVQGLVKPYHVTPRLVIKSNVESALSRIVMLLLNKLNLAQTKHSISGCCQAMHLLSEEYLTSCHSQAWGCGPPAPLLPKESTARYRRPPTRSLSGSSTFSLEELTSGSGGGPLPTILSLLTSSPVTLDLTTHQYALHLAGNLIAGSAYNCLRTQELDSSKTENQTEENTWPALSNRVLVPLIDHLLIHVARVLNAFAHVIDEQQPGPPQMKSALPSLPTAPSLSPIKRKAKGEKEVPASPATPTQDNKTTQKPAQKEKESEKEKSKKEGLGTFYTYPHYVKFYEVLKGAYSSYKISLELSSADKFCSMLRTTLAVFSQILEVASLQDTGKYAEEFLNYLRTTVTLKPADTVLCVQQLLKSLFGTNLCSQWEDNQLNSLTNRKSGKLTRLSGNKDGLYQSMFTLPYSQFTQTLAASTIKAVSPDHEDTTGVLTWLKKCVERKVPAILKPSSKADKTAIASYIRLFEPLVIKALKQYTVTSSLCLQQQVLDLLSQLVQLRVNYCLLDSDQVFIGFVIKQFEYIEEGQIRNSEILVPNIFNFLVMLSYEKFHSKPVITMPKIIQLCDGIMASGLHPTTHAIPALQPIVYDLFLLRGANKSDISKDLETQREVIVSMLLRLIQYYEAVDMFVVILQQCHRESEERWKRLSRQVTDTILPALTKLQVKLDSQVALDVVHRLFESVAPIVFRPVDILLKTILMRPADIGSAVGLQRWSCLVLAILRVLMAQSKEEVVLSRINELGLKLQLVKTQDPELTEREREVVNSLTPEEVMARFFLQTIGKISYTLTTLNRDVEGQSYHFLCQQLSHLLMYITHMFQSGSFRRVATASIQAINQQKLACFYDIREINSYMLEIGVCQPTLTLQWCNVLILLNFSDQSFWSGVMKTPKKYIMASSSSESKDADTENGSTEREQQCTNQEILRRGGLVLFCDYACENLNDSEHMTWVIINHVRDLIELCEESPVQDFISAIHRNSAASSLFIQAIHARWDDVTPPSVVKKALKCLDAIHFSQSGALLTLLIDKFLNTHHLAVARSCDNIACRRVEMLLAEAPQEKMKQLPVDDLDKLLNFITINKLTKKHARLLSLLNKFRDSITDDKSGPVPAEGGHPLKLLSLNSGEITMDKEFYMSLVKEQCFTLTPNIRECANLLQYLDYSDMLDVMMAKEFHLSILGECMSLGGLKTLERYSRDMDMSTEQTHRLEWTLDPLFQASQLTLMRHINNIINILPVPHQLVNFGDIIHGRLTRYVEKLEDFFTDNSSVEILFHLVMSLVEYLVSLSVFPWKPKVPLESQSDVCRFCVFSLECISWMMCHNQLPTTEQLHTSLKFVSVVLQNLQLSTLIGHKDHVTWVCSLTRSVRQIVSALCVLPGQQFCEHSRTDDTPTDTQTDDFHHLTSACDAISELVQFILHDTRSPVGRSEIVLPNSLSSLIHNVAIGLSRMPVLNSYARTPPVVWKMGWLPVTSGEPNTKLPPLPVDLMLDQEVLKELIHRVNTIGWISRQQFEETWMSLLGLLNPVSSDEHISREEDIERTHCMVLTVRAITGMLMHTMIVPTPGDPAHGMFDVQPRDKPLGFLHTRCGKKLTVIRGMVENEVQSLSSARCVNVRGTDTYKFDYNLEREVAVDTYTLGQVSVESIWSVVGVLDPVHSESDTTDSMESPSHHDNTHVTMATSPAEPNIPRDPSVAVAGLDVHSCLQFLLDLYRQWLVPGNNGKPPLMLLNEVIKSVVSLSDLFAEREQFEWMLDVMFEVYKAHPGEDEIALQYLNVGVCKAAAVVGVDNTTADRLIKIIDNGYKSTHLPSKTATLHGTLYLLEAAIPDVTKQLVPLTTEFILKHLTLVSRQAVSSEKYILTMWATAFYILENYSTEVKDTEFPQQILQLGISMASSSEDSVSTSVYLTILKGLERLLLTDVLLPSDAEMIVKLSVDRLCLPSPQRSLAALGLLFTCMYSGKQYDGYSPRPREHETFNMEEPANIYQDPESLIVAMERVTVLFDRIKKGYPYEARVISRVLPSFLADFFPPQDIMNKVIGEFLSSQQPYPQLIAKVVFQVFSNLHEQRQHGLLKDWVMLSLSNFTQRTPVAMAMWSLTCFFISASVNPWLRNLLSYVLSRMGKIEVSDKKLFCMAGLDFYSQLTDDVQRRAFHATFQTVRTNHPDSPYSDLLNLLVKPPS